MPGSPNARAERPRFGWLDAVILAAVAVFVAFLVYRVDSVLYYRWNWSRLWPYVIRPDGTPGVLLAGFMTTIRLSLYGIMLAAMLGLVFGLMRTSRRLFPRLMARAYVEIVRNTPVLVQMYFIFFGSSIVGYALSGFVAGLIALTLQNGAYIA